MSKLPASHVWWADGHRFTRLIISSSFPTSFRSLQCNYSARRPLALKFLICAGRGRAFLASFILFCCCRTMPRKVTDFNDFFIIIFYSWFLCVHVGRAHVTRTSTCTKYYFRVSFSGFWSFLLNESKKSEIGWFQVLTVSPMDSKPPTQTIS